MYFHISNKRIPIDGLVKHKPYTLSPGFQKHSDLGLTWSNFSVSNSANF